MLFIDSTLRSLCLKKNMKKACEIITELSFLFCEKIKSQNNFLIFDRGDFIENKKSEIVNFSVSIARPNFETSDDALIGWAVGLSATDLANSLFVTSDRELLSRLIEKGATNVMKSGAFWKIMKETIGEKTFHDIVSKGN